MQMNMVQSINSALGIAMEKDARVILLGEDIGRGGGVFRVTAGLQEKFGEDRVIDTPLAEQGIVGVSIGMAALGLRPVPEIQFDGFSYVSLDQLINHAARLRLRTHGRLHCPLVLRFPVGGGIKALEHHSENPETYYAHVPGLKTVMPSGPYDAKGLLLSCLSPKEEDPIVFMEPKRIYRAFKEEVPEDNYEIELGKARIIQEGEDLTLITYGATVRTALNAVSKFTESDSGKSSIELIDLRTLSPLDEETILSSVKKTGRVLIAHEAAKTIGLGAEISALISEEAVEFLKAPILRVSGFDVPMPLAKSEDYYIPSVERILAGIGQVLSYKS
ncbi:MAG TPA: alpha-ketoacid dehydrogenase subunit beta [Nitrososphaerales archaeon]|nr:alpha-ketoacid dehydrogenase subunit beta [Nitrososphaerales archaeon]